MLDNNELTNYGENWYEFEYYSYLDGCRCLYKMPEHEYEHFKERYDNWSDETREVMLNQGIKTLDEYIKAVLALNN